MFFDDRGYDLIDCSRKLENIISHAHEEQLYPQAIKSKADFSKHAAQQVKFANSIKDVLAYYSKEGHRAHLRRIFKALEAKV
ncbi:hypothetical protein DSO57_1002199 [Entomophthora muscae]|uniref:Uncharacterized protein n=1 Tax=Entomophthora muscae TaxID=34485 RepID=A0ACC2U8D6_9FUNG|nr:hypothetical protein DSO57_1002199 [Entomophthora muscae]